MTKPAEATLGDISLNRLAVCECSDFNVCFVIEKNKTYRNIQSENGIL